MLKRTELLKRQAAQGLVPDEILESREEGLRHSGRRLDPRAAAADVRRSLLRFEPLADAAFSIRPPSARCSRRHLSGAPICASRSGPSPCSSSGKNAGEAARRKTCIYRHLACPLEGATAWRAKFSSPEAQGLSAATLELRCRSVAMSCSSSTTSIRSIRSGSSGGACSPCWRRARGCFQLDIRDQDGLRKAFAETKPEVRRPPRRARRSSPVAGRSRRLHGRQRARHRLRARSRAESGRAPLRARLQLELGLWRASGAAVQRDGADRFAAEPLCREQSRERSAGPHLAQPLPDGDRRFALLHRLWAAPAPRSRHPQVLAPDARRTAAPFFRRRRDRAATTPGWTTSSRASLASLRDPLGYDTFNLGGARTTTLRELLVTMLENALGVKAILDRQPPQKGDMPPHQRRRLPLAAQKLGYSPHTPIDQGIVKFADWIRGDGADWVYCSLLHAEKLDFKHQRGVGRNHAARAARCRSQAPAEWSACACRRPSSTGHALVPALDHLADADGEFERLAAIDRRIELLPVGQPARVVDLDGLALLRRRAGSRHQLLDLQLAHDASPRRR